MSSGYIIREFVEPVFYVSYMTLYFQEIFSASKENEKYTVFLLWIFFYDPCLISRKSYMILVWLLRNHTNHIWPCMITRNHIWPSITTRNYIWWATQVLLIFHLNISPWYNYNFHLYLGSKSAKLQYTEKFSLMWWFYRVKSQWGWFKITKGRHTSKMNAEGNCRKQVNRWGIFQNKPNRSIKFFGKLVNSSGFWDRQLKNERWGVFLKKNQKDEWRF